MTPTFDAHTHIWQNHWQDMIVATGRSGRLDQLRLVLTLMDRHGVERACVLAACDDANPDNNAFVADICRRHADRFVMFSEIPLLSDHRDELLDRTLTDWPARGIRYHLSPDEQPETWSGPVYDTFWRRINDARLFVALNLNPYQTAQLAPLIQRYPDVTWLLDHMGRPRYDMTDEQYRPVLDLAAFDRVYVKVSGFYAFTADAAEYPYTDLARFIVALRDAYGAHRLLWGSDAPPALDFGSFAQTYRCLDHIPALSEDDLAWILSRTAKELFR